MIVPMKKVTLLVLETEREKALKDLRALGLVHVETKQTESKTLTELKTLQNRLLSAISVLNDAAGKDAKRAKKTFAGAELPEEKILAMLDEVHAMSERKKEISAELVKITSIMQEYSGFGNFNPQDFAYLQEKGVTVAIAAASAKQYEALFVPGAISADTEKSNLQVIKLADEKKKITFLIVAGSEGLPATIDSSITILPLPKKSNSEYAHDRKALHAEMANLEQRLKTTSESVAELEAFAAFNTKRIEFESVYAGMQTTELRPCDEVADVPSLGLSWLVGYIPAKDAGALKKLAAEKAWAIVSEEPTEQDVVPTKLKGNAATNMIHPLFEFLNMFPGYFEFDVSWSVLIFFGIFTAMIFGDAGYGSLAFLGGLFVALKNKFSGKKITDELRLLLYLSAMTIIWGTLSCSWFGINVSMIPSFLKSLSIEGLVNEDTKNSNIMFVSFTIGAVHLIIAHVIALLSGKKTLKVLAHLGAIAMLVGMYCLILNLIVSAERFPMHNWMLMSIAIGFVFDFVFCNYETGIGASVLASLKDIISKVLGVVNVFSDIMSYVRLWAVGLAGASISMAVNSIAGPMLGSAIMFIFGILICVFGHGLNMALNVLSVIVHAVRLNSMEFSGHAGLGWSGIKYKPFMEQQL